MADGPSTAEGSGAGRAYHRILGRHAPALRRATVVLVVGVVAAAILFWYLPWEMTAILGWDAAAVTFLASTAHLIAGADAADTQRLASKEDDTRTAATVLLVVASMGSLLGVGFAIGLAGERSDGLRILLIAVAALTVALSWLSLNTIYTLRYAHLYYGSAPGAIAFGERDPHTQPSYRDFAYLAFTIGMTYQVSDTTLRDPRIRRSVLTHAAFAYVFGVVIIAGAINLIAGLMRN